MTNRIRIAAVGLTAVAFLGLSPSAQAATDPDYSRPCQTVNDLDCTLTVVQAVQQGMTVRKVGNSQTWEVFRTEASLLGSLDDCRTKTSTLADDVESLNQRVLQDQKRIGILKAKIERLRDRLHHNR